MQQGLVQREVRCSKGKYKERLDAARVSTERG